MKLSDEKLTPFEAKMIFDKLYFIIDQLTEQPEYKIQRKSLRRAALEILDISRGDVQNEN